MSDFASKDLKLGLQLGMLPVSHDAWAGFQVTNSYPLIRLWVFMMSRPYIGWVPMLLTTQIWTTTPD